MANTNWRFTALEFLVAWQHLGHDRLPFPLTFVGAAESALEYDEQRRQAAIVVRDRMDDNLYRALTVLAEPLARVEVCGFNGPQLTSMIRVHAGVDNSIGAVAAQQPGPTFDVGTDIFLSLHSTASVGTRIVGVLPPMDAGRLRGITVDKNDIGGRPKSTSVLSDVHQLSPGSEAKRFFDRAYNTYGEITVDRGPSYDGRKDKSGRVFQFIDYVDDGRYLVRQSQSVSAIPASPQTLAAEVQRFIDVARAKVVRA